MKYRIISFVLFALFALGQWSCEKDEQDYFLEVVVTVEDSVRVQNALVHITAPVEGSFIDYYLTTDESGVVSIELENKAVLDISASKPPFKGCTFAEVDRGLTTRTLDMKRFDNENNGCRPNQ